jgi:hypothetical protein
MGHSVLVRTCAAVVALMIQGSGLPAVPSFEARIQAQSAGRSLPATGRGVIERMAVAIDTGKPGACAGAALIVGYDQTRAYAVTTQELVGRLADGKPAPKFHVTLRASTSATRASDRAKGSRVPVNLIHQSQSSRIAVFEITDPAIVAAASKMTFDVLGPAEDLTRRDSVAPIPCPDGANGSKGPEPRPLIGLIKNLDSFVFGGEDIANVGHRYAGGPMIHVLGSRATIVGLVLVGRERTHAIRIDRVVASLREWKIPVRFSAPATESGCVYTYKIRRPGTSKGDETSVMFASSGRDLVNVHVETAANCSWTAYGDDSFWFRVAGATSGASPVRRGPGIVSISPTRANMCDGRMRSGVAYVAGRLIRIEQDGTAMSMGCNAGRTSSSGRTRRARR